MTDTRHVKLKPGDTIGILGGGQLGRMLAMAAARLGISRRSRPIRASPRLLVTQECSLSEREGGMDGYIS